MAGEKKMAIVVILKILQDETDENNPLNQSEIKKILSEDYGIDYARKAIGDSVKLLIGLGYPICHTRQEGYYMNKKVFTDPESNVLIDAILASKCISTTNTKKLIDKIVGLAGKNFKTNAKRVLLANDWDKTENDDLFKNVNNLAIAIEKGRQVEFDYYKYQKNKKLDKTSHQVVSPYQLVMHNQRYYLMCHDDRHTGIAYFRVDRMKEIRINTDIKATDIRSVQGYKAGIDFKKFSRCLPYMFADYPETIIFKAENWAIDQVIEWFGKDINIEDIPGDDKHVQVTVTVSPNAMEYWVLQFSKGVEVIYPNEFKERIINDIKEMAKKYGIYANNTLLMN